MKFKLIYLKEIFYGNIVGILATTLSYDINKLKGSVNSGSPFRSIKLIFDGEFLNLK